MAESAEGARLLSEYVGKLHRGFESLSLRHFANPFFATDVTNTDNAPLAQLDRASGYGPEGREFESSAARHTLKKHLPV